MKAIVVAAIGLLLGAAAVVTKAKLWSRREAPSTGGAGPAAEGDSGGSTTQET